MSDEPIKKKRVLPEALKKNLYKPGQSGNPNGRRKRKYALVDYLREFFSEEVTVPTAAFGKNGQKYVKMKREKYFAMMIGQAALTSSDSQIRRDCIKIVVDTLWPKSTKPVPFIQINQQVNNQMARGFFDEVQRLAGDAPVTPSIVLEALRKTKKIEDDEQ